ncbi:MBL fold metallo-hydrolase [bacterium]|nr:MBL fold metallo-hydrolase [candidate division CSSED10-310 bacterium]
MFFRDGKILVRRRFFGAFAAVLILTGCQPAFQRESGGWDVLFLDVGYGDAAIVSRPPVSVLIDGGYSVWTSCLLDTFRALHIDRLDAVIVTHPHPDHLGGVYGVMASGFPCIRIYGAFPLEHPENPPGFRKLFESGEHEYIQCRRGDRIDVGGVLTFRVLHPDMPGPDLNDSSMVTLMEFCTGNILFAADIGPAAQRDLLRVFGDGLRSGILKCPHHGGVSDPDFIRSVRPDIAVISVGVNPYGNPAPETLEILGQTGAKIIRSDRDGSLRVHCGNGGKISLRKWNVPCGTF